MSPNLTLFNDQEEMGFLSNVIRITLVAPANLAAYCNEARVFEINFASKQILVEYSSAKKMSDSSLQRVGERGGVKSMGSDSVAENVFMTMITS